jgi:CTP:molybdopterin cytidylyltransferase MocA
VASHYGDVQAPPTLYDRALFDELLQIPGERCAKQVVRRHEREADIVAWPESALRDVDSPADYEDARVALTRP